jgi:hypothetical protein
MKILLIISIFYLLLGCKPTGNYTNIVDENDKNIISSPIDFNQSTQSVLEDTFVRNSKSNDNINMIWNLSFKTFDADVKKTFDIAIHILKDTPVTIGNILIKGVSIKENKIFSIDSLTIFGKKSSGTTGSIKYASDDNITINSVTFQDKILFVNLGYIMENQTIVSQKSFQKKSYYSIDVYVFNLNIGATLLDEVYRLQVEYDKFYLFPQKKTQSLSGLIIIED